jgi:hypothetical protein
MSNPARWFLLAAISVLLGGCFSSAGPKFSSETAAAAFGDGGRYTVFQYNKDESYTRVGVITVNHRADGGYDFIDDKGKPSPYSFHAAGSDLFVMVEKTRRKQFPYLYHVVRVGADEVIFYNPDCDAQDRQKLTELGVTLHQWRRKRFECVIDGVADPAGLFAIVTLGPPMAKLVRE